MQLEFDLSVGALYVRLADGPVVRTVELDDNTNVDVAGDGTVVGIEVVDVDLPWQLDGVLDSFSIPQAEVDQLRLYFQGLGMYAHPDAVPAAVPSLSVEPVKALAAA